MLEDDFGIRIRVIREGYPALLDASVSGSMEAALFFLLPFGGESLSFYSSFSSSFPSREERASESSDIVSEGPLRWGHFWPPCPSSWFSSPACGTAPELASSSAEDQLGFRAVEPDIYQLWLLRPALIKEWKS